MPNIVVLTVFQVFTVLMSLAPFKGDVGEPLEARRARTWLIAEDVVKVSRTEHEAARLISHQWHETKYAKNIFEGHCERMPKGQRCDNGRSRGFAQVRPVSCRQAFAYADGSRESQLEEAACAVRLLSSFAGMGRSHALTPDHAAFSGMAARGGHLLWNWGKADERVKTMHTIEARLVRARDATPAEAGLASRD